MPDPTHVVTETGAGDGAPLVLVHGVGLDHTMWDLVVERLLARPAGPSTIVRYDLVGHGRSAPVDDPTHDLTLHDCIDQLLAVADGCPDMVGPGVGRPDVVGLSLGGTVVRGAAARHPDRFRRVVVANTVFDRDHAQRRGNLDRQPFAEEGRGPPETSLP